MCVYVGMIYNHQSVMGRIFTGADTWFYPHSPQTTDQSTNYRAKDMIEQAAPMSLRNKNDVHCFLRLSWRYAPEIPSAKLLTKNNIWI